MTDRQLLELAARAAGYKVTPHANHQLSPKLVFAMNGKNWNPLTDDGDALRLAVTLQLQLDLRHDLHEVHVYGAPSGRIQEGSKYPDAATRRAIVRAAAEIGEKM